MDFGVALWQLAIYTVLSMLLLMGARQYPYLKEHPKEIKRLPVLVLVATWLQFVRTYALITLYKVNVWGTRAGADSRLETSRIHFDSDPGGHKAMNSGIAED
jgi:hypothetical protein